MENSTFVSVLGNMVRNRLVRAALECAQDKGRWPLAQQVLDMLHECVERERREVVCPCVFACLFMCASACWFTRTRVSVYALVFGNVGLMELTRQSQVHGDGV